MAKCKYPNEVCANMTVLNGVTYCGSVPCSLKDELPQQTNADRIRSMSDEELAKENVYFVSELVAKEGLRYTGLDGHYYRTGAEVVEANMKWLQAQL